VVKAIYRDISKIEDVKRVFLYYTLTPEDYISQIIWVKADITDLPSLSLSFSYVSEVYHCASNLSFDKNDYDIARKVNVEGTANIVNLCLFNEVTRLCYVSSIATIGEDFTKPITEETKWNPENNTDNIYAITKYDAELEVWRGAQEGLTVIIVNPGVIIGSGFWERGIGRFFNKVANGFCFYSSGSVGVVDVSDVVGSMIKLMRLKVINEQFILVAENFTYKELMINISRVTENGRKLRKIKQWQLLLYMQIDRLFSYVFKKKRTVYKANVKSLYKNLVYDSSKIKKTTGINFMSIAISIRDTARLRNI
jgi:nucleoside-diphosphate-sugar epimerase